MQHNLVLIERGSTEAFGKIVDKFLQSPDAAEMEYVPQSRYVLGATEMLDPGEKGVLRVRLPDKAGDYPFICTFPGHWRMMQGILKVSPRGSYASADPDALNVAVMGGGSSHDFSKIFRCRRWQDPQSKRDRQCTLHREFSTTRRIAHHK